MFLGWDTCNSSGWPCFLVQHTLDEAKTKVCVCAGGGITAMGGHISLVRHL